MILLVDNTKNLKKAYMTPRIINIFKNQNINFTIIPNVEKLNNIILHNKDNIKGIILSGGPLCLSEELTIKSINKNITALLEFPEIPILGICFGFQIIAASYGGLINQMNIPEEGIYTIDIDNDTPIFKGLEKKIKVFQSHRDKLVQIPPSFQIIANSNNNNINIIQGIVSNDLKRYGVQFHPEGLDETRIIIKNFIDICYNKNYN